MAQGRPPRGPRSERADHRQRRTDPHRLVRVTQHNPHRRGHRSPRRQAQRPRHVSMGPLPLANQRHRRVARRSHAKQHLTARQPRGHKHRPQRQHHRAAHRRQRRKRHRRHPQRPPLAPARCVAPRGVQHRKGQHHPGEAPAGLDRRHGARRSHVQARTRHRCQQHRGAQAQGQPGHRQVAPVQPRQRHRPGAQQPHHRQFLRPVAAAHRHDAQQRHGRPQRRERQPKACDRRPPPRRVLLTGLHPRGVEHKHRRRAQPQQARSKPVARVHPGERLHQPPPHRSHQRGRRQPDPPALARDHHQPDLQHQQVAQQRPAGLARITDQQRRAEPAHQPQQRHEAPVPKRQAHRAGGDQGQQHKTADRPQKVIHTRRRERDPVQIRHPRAHQRRGHPLRTPAQPRARADHPKAKHRGQHQPRAHRQQLVLPRVLHQKCARQSQRHPADPHKHLGPQGLF